MKKKVDRDLIILILIIPIFLFVAFYISNIQGNGIPSYSVANKSKMGYSVFYEALKELNYPVERTLKPLSEYQTNGVQILPPGGKFDVNNQEVQQWVEKGGTLVYLTSGNDTYIKYGIPVDTKGNIKLYTYHKGRIINANADFMANKTLTKDTSNAYGILEQISKLPYEKLYFNESYLFSAANTKSLWDNIPIEIKYIIYQMLIALGAFFYCKGKRFGKTVSLYEEVERSENEYLYSAASLYRQAKCLDLMVDNYYKNFLKEFKGNEEHWLEYWEKEKIPSLHQAKKVYEFMKYKKVKPKPKEYLQIVTMIEYLNKVLDKRRDIHWKTLKRTLQNSLQKE
jgi:hypothetical protein